MFSVVYGKGFEVAKPVPMRQRVERMQQELSKLPQCELRTEHDFHAGMYCRQVWQFAGVQVVGKVHKKEHFFIIVSGTVAVTTDDGPELITGPRLLKSSVGTKRAIYSVDDAVYMTVHRCESQTVEDAERELVEDDPTAMFGIGNKIMCEVLK